MSDGTITFSGRIVDGNTTRDQLVTIETDLSQAPYPEVVKVIASGTQLAAFETREEAQSFIDSANIALFYR